MYICIAQCIPAAPDSKVTLLTLKLVFEAQSHDATGKHVPVVVLACFRAPRMSSSSGPSHNPGFVPAEASSASLSVPEAPAFTICTTSCLFTGMPQAPAQNVNALHADCVSQDTEQYKVHSSSHNLRCILHPYRCPHLSNFGQTSNWPSYTCTGSYLLLSSRPGVGPYLLTLSMDN